MNLKQTFKAILIGFCFGIGLTWLLSVFIPITMNIDVSKFIHECGREILQTSFIIGLISSGVWVLASDISRKRRKREELEDAMTEYFRKKIEDDKVD